MNDQKENKVKPFLVGIAGGSGAGKSTIAYELRDRYPDKVCILRFDDYQLEDEKKVPLYKGFRNWDDPKCVDFNQLISDLSKLKDGEEVAVRTWGSRENPDYKDTGKRITITIKPKPVVLVEGYLALYNKEVRDFFDLTIYLDAPDHVRVKRRNKLQDDAHQGYDEEVLAPMHKKYVLPTMEYANHVFDTSILSKEEIIGDIVQLLPL